MKLKNLSPCDKGIDLVVRCCCEKGSEVADLAEVLTPGGDCFRESNVCKHVVPMQ